MTLEPHYQNDEVTLYAGDCLEVLRQLPDNSVHSVVTDPPYGLSNTDPAHVAETITRWVNGDREYLPSGKGFMGKDWDAFVPPVAVWDECLRVLKPGGHILAFAGSRTMDLMTLGIRLAGFEIRDSIAWLYGSGFPKSMDASKAIDKAAGATREDLGPGQWAHVRAGGTWNGPVYGAEPSHAEGPRKTSPATPEAQQWGGWGTALKPAFEPVVVARKPLDQKTVAANVLTHGTGALNIDASRIETDENRSRPPRTANALYGGGAGTNLTASESNPAGRFPANVVLDESQAEALDRQSGITGGASRFFYCAKAPKAERPVVDGVAHPTVKPLALMRYLVKLVTPPDGVVLEPFAGSGSTAEAAVLEGFRCVAIERETSYLPLIVARLKTDTQSSLLNFSQD